MGADRYTVCPQCRYLYDDEMRKLADKIASDYPSLSPAAQEALLGVLAEEQDLSEPGRTFREDYEFAHGDNDGDVRVMYGGHCSTCGLSFKLDETHVFWQPPEAQS